MYFLHKMGIVHCHVSLPEGKMFLWTFGRIYDVGSEVLKLESLKLRQVRAVLKSSLLKTLIQQMAEGRVLITLDTKA